MDGTHRRLTHNAPSCNDMNIYVCHKFFNALLGNYKIMEQDDKMVVNKMRTQRKY
jgi:hypothetical protein